jgi:ligand-binding sensor protein
MSEIHLSDIIDISDLQKLQDAFAKANGIASTIVDLTGKPITVPSIHSKVCTLVRETSKGLENCMVSGAHLGLKAIEAQKPYYDICESVGFLDAAAPIIIDGAHVANWVIGQNCVGDVDDNRILTYADEIGADKQEMLDAFHEMHKIPKSKFLEKLDFLSIMANQISQLAYKNKSNMDLIKTLRETQEELEDHKNNLEVLVKKKTDEVKNLSGLLPICMHCKKIRDDRGYWNKIEAYIQSHSVAEFSHGICEVCLEKYYPEDEEEEK